MKKAYVKEKAKRRYVRTSMLREEAIAFSDSRRLVFVLVGLGACDGLGRTSRSGARPMRGVVEAIWKIWG